jgi:hypothetical protein
MGMSRCLDFRVEGNLLILRENSLAPTEEDWDAFLLQLKLLRPRMNEMRAMVFTDGGGPSAAQRKRLSRVIGDAPIHTAVVTDSAAIKFVISSIALFNKLIRTFSSAEVLQAYRWLGLRPRDQLAVERALADMRLTVRDLRPEMTTGQRG